MKSISPNKMVKVDVARKKYIIINNILPSNGVSFGIKRLRGLIFNGASGRPPFFVLKDPASLLFFRIMVFNCVVVDEYE